MSIFPSDEQVLRNEILFKELQNQTDRGVAIVGVAWVEEALLAALESFLQDDKKARNSLFGTNGPVSTFSARIYLARLLGMTSKVITSDLHILRKLRNEFAHSVLDAGNNLLSFTTPGMSDRCLSLKCIKHEKHPNPRVAFIHACAVLNWDFHMHQFGAQKVKNGGLIHAQVENRTLR